MHMVLQLSFVRFPFKAVFKSCLLKVTLFLPRKVFFFFIKGSIELLKTSEE